MAGPRHALVLTAGLGTRLRPLTDVRAKPAIPVAGVPIARRIISWLVRSGADDIVLNLHHLPQTIASAVGDGCDLSARVRYSWEGPLLLGSAGGPRQALSIVGADTFFIVNGDVLTDVDLEALYEAHCAGGATITLALVPHDAPDRYGGVRVDDDGRVRDFPSAGVAGDAVYHFVGVQVVEADAFRSLSLGQPAQSIRGLYDRLIADRPGSVRGFVSRADFRDIGTVADYWQTSWSMDAPAASPAAYGDRTRVSPASIVSRSILWDNVVVNDGCVVEDCILTDGVALPPGTTLRRTIVSRSMDGSNRTFPFDPAQPSER
jgi:NDP-sugar pyrophosphorylase family protein